MSFIEDHSSKLSAVRVKYQNEDLKKPMSITLRRSAFFSFSCQEADEFQAQEALRNLAGTGVPQQARA